MTDFVRWGKHLFDRDSIVYVVQRVGSKIAVGFRGGSEELIWSYNTDEERDKELDGLTEVLAGPEPMPVLVHAPDSSGQDEVFTDISDKVVKTVVWGGSFIDD